MKLIELTKICTKCGERKSFKEFHKRKDGCFGVRSICGVCIKIWYENNIEKIKVWRKSDYLKNKEKINIRNKKYIKENIEKVNAQRKNSRDKNREKNRIYDRIYYKLNYEKINFRNKIYRDANSEKIGAQIKAYRKANPEKIKSQRKIFRKNNIEGIKNSAKKSYNKRKLEPNFKLNSIMGGGIGRSLKNGNGKNGHHWENLVPYNINDLIRRLKKTLPDGYVWDDYINCKTDLQVDHIIPISVHNFKSYTDTDFQKCWALKNLQLLSAKDNLKKRAKLIKHFQPSLLL